MKNDIKKYLTLGAVLAGTAFMVSCDDGDSVDVIQDSGVADAINDALGDKPVAPIALAEYPLTSLKLSIESGGATCSTTSLNPGDELEIDFDSTDVTDAADTTADGFADLDIEGANGFFGSPNNFGSNQGFIDDIENLGSTFTIGGIYEGVDTSGNLLLGNLTFTPLVSDQRSVSGRFIGSATVEVALNQDTDNVVVDLPNPTNITLANPNGGDFDVNSVTFYQDVAGKNVEVESLDASVTHEELLGSTNYGVSLNIDVNGTNCTVNFALGKTAADLAAGGDVANLTILNEAEIQAIMVLLSIEVTLDVSDAVPVVNEIAAETTGVHLIEANTLGGIEGSYRHDYDSTFGAPEDGINSSSEFE